MKKFFVLLGIPADTMKDWMANVDEKTRKEQTDKMMKDWQAWMSTHDKSILDKGLPLGKTKRVTKEGVTDVINDLNWYIIVEAESHDDAAKMFVGHPHLEIPGAYAEVMDASRPMGM